jgi:hypothetical protein
MNMNRQELQLRFAADIIDGMDMDGLIEYATRKLDEYYDTLSDNELMELIEESADYLLEETNTN